MKLKKPLLITSAVLAAAALFLVITGLVCMNRVNDITTDIDEVPHIDLFDNGFLSSFCLCSAAPEDIDTSAVGEHQIEVKYLGIIKKSVSVRVEDLTPPTAEAYRITAVQGTALSAEDFVKSVNDKTEIEFTADGIDTETLGTHKVCVTLTDVGGNSTSLNTELEIISPDFLPFTEYGDSTEEAIEKLCEMYTENLDTGAVENECGSYAVCGENGDNRYFLSLTVKDTTPPTAEAVNLDIRRGDNSVGADDFVNNITDLSETSVSFADADTTDFSSAGEYTVKISVSDIYGNTTELEAICNVWDIPETVMVECGTDRVLLEKVISGYVGTSSDAPFVEKSFNPLSLDIGSYDTVLQCEFNSLALNVTVEDTTPPSGRAVRLDTIKGVSIPAEDFITDIDDVSEVKVEFKNEPDFNKIGKQNIVLILTDVLGNTGEVASSVVVWDIPKSITVECGTSTANVIKQLGKSGKAPTADDESDTSSLAPGEHKLKLRGTYSDFEITLIIEDTTAPTAQPSPADIRLGQTPAAEELVKNISDFTEVTCKYKTKPDFTTSGTKKIDIVLTDTSGNSTTVRTTVNVWNVPEKFTLECGTSLSSLQSTVKKYTCGDKTLTVSGMTDCKSKLPGTYTASLNGEYSGIEVSLVFSDTKAPVLILRNVSVYVGASVSAKDFVVSCTDNTSVSYAFVSSPDCSYAHTENVSIKAYDNYGNETVETASLTVMTDTVPPTIYGTKTIYALIGETISYRKNVYATDNVDGDVYVSVDSSAVNTSAEGTYYATYKATDKAGNITTVTIEVVVGDINQAMIDKLADDIIADIITDTMTDREKAYAVYTWVQNNISYSSSTSYLMGQFVPSVYSGITTHAGNCYIQFAVSKELLDRIGIENMMIQRDKPDNPHYWNLVKIDGNWYHFDATNRVFKNFLLTDAEVAYYSTYINKGYYSYDASLYPQTP